MSEQRPPPEPLGDCALRLLRLPGEDGATLLAAARAIPSVTGAVITERHLCLHFDPAQPPLAPLEALAAALLRTARRTVEPRLHLVPVRYDGPDLSRVAAHAGLAVAEVGALHASREYTVLVVGFLPGFAYLGEVEERLAAPRLPSPRPRVSPNSVAIAGARTGIYPLASPGGWNLVGTALSVRPFDPATGALFALGDRVRFEPVS